MTKKNRGFRGYFSRRLGIFLRAVFGVIAPTLFFLHSCGIEAYYYLPEVPPGNITTSINQSASVSLPGNLPSYFTYFALYYRIYISYDQPVANTGNLRDVNPVLDSDYRYLASYTSATSTTGINVASVMGSRSYQPLFFETGSGISGDILDTGGTMRIEFPFSAASAPSISYPGGTARLMRSDGGGAFSPRPDRYFINSSELNNPANISATVNADVVNASGSGSTRYAYAAIYIASTGLNEQSFMPIFSIPTFVGIFRLP
ncbi:MAG: hypothetical protein LBP20_06260 [Treponema sp.]|jgi:hypothetical protein|nr:hypothetical protein [Treponema sp.]